MDELNVCTPPNVESDAQNYINSSTLPASATAPDKVINIKTDCAQFGGSVHVSDEELLKGLLTDQRCHVCEAVLLFESQRLSHYEGKKHGQKVKMYLQTKKSEMNNTESTGPQRSMPTDKDRFCELCNMVFSSAVVAKSHYNGKVHTKNVRKHCLQQPGKNTEVSTVPSPPTVSANDDHVSGLGDGTDPTSAATAASSDPNKYCVLCAASFNNHQMALQHYNGRKHQRKKARHELLKELEDDEANPLTCRICSLQFNSVEMYQAHMQGNKHHTRQRKVFKLHKSQQKSYSTFADELSDYIEVQKARGLTPKIGQVLPKVVPPMEGDQHQQVEDLHMAPMTQQNQPMASFYGQYYPPYPTQPCYPCRPWPSQVWNCNSPPSFLSSKASLEYTAQPLKRHRKCSGSSYTTSSSSSSSSYCSSSSSGASDNDLSGHRQRERRRARRSKRDRGRLSRDSDKAKRKPQKRVSDSEERSRDDNGESGEERRRKRKYHRGHARRRLEEERGVKDNEEPEDVMENTNKTEGNVEQLNHRHDEYVKAKSRKEKKKTKDTKDNRTEEEKLWDDSILGC
ncbi:zinc finger matrin-type protein 1 [Dunckerocampus dactyliophorus]|uniref:zinc finger matrin-type protein 1 n=1 Tax=Dunckerocampus dactyliophorus TaxID=161453 RepID=UPI002404A209|nr:zinc finger matrin-type protein 1 [Dunckerocampus dactyliophorus]